MKKMQPRQIVLGVALVTTLIAVFLPQPDGGNGNAAVVEPAARDAAVAGPGATQEGASGLVASIARTEVAVSDIDPFRTKSWYVPPPPPPVQEAPKPTAPPLPFRYIGMFEDRGKATIFLARGNESFAVTAGDRFADTYRLEKIERGMLVINYVPLSINQTLPIGTSE